MATKKPKSGTTKNKKPTRRKRAVRDLPTRRDVTGALGTSSFVDNWRVQR
jgi:hypothetical protein